MPKPQPQQATWAHQMSATPPLLALTHDLPPFTSPIGVRRRIVSLSRNCTSLGVRHSGRSCHGVPRTYRRTRIQSIELSNVKLSRRAVQDARITGPVAAGLGMPSRATSGSGQVASFEWCPTSLKSTDRAAHTRAPAAPAAMRCALLCEGGPKCRGK